MIPEPYKYAFNHLDDDRLWAELKSGSQKAFEYVYQKNVQNLFDYGMHLHADSDLIKDAIQELFIHIWQRRNSLGDVKNIRNYLMVSFRRCVITHLEAHKKWHVPMLEKIRYSVEEVDVSQESRMIANEVFVRQEQDLMTAIEKLPSRQKEIIYLLFFKKFSQKEIAQMMCINLASVYTLTSKAIKNLKKQLK
ncbi:RNA polymerase sigma factor (sigma-70 family) [Catalinimonas alkaloidigena]|uniref:RNA polymerase sigma factor n=1 Tax=Catalinimonas alkaloidigena TaxID=1075417 RepID=UPI002406BA42|nr:sigma-70 family RNA polymerase sigma factor [Catalinimonas alkaloidigena]MDF9796399.1 RNA polymerase sigma factor (sigma-70 family) [Catalinimonas alkaloidigena]